MDQTDLTQQIVHRLGDGASVNDLTFELCESHNLTWPEAQALVEAIRKRQERVIAKRQLPLLFIIALGIFLGGLALVIYDTYLLISILKTDLAEFWLSLDILVHLRLVFDVALAPISGITLGSAMMLGSIVGMRRAWTPLLDRG